MKCVEVTRQLEALLDGALDRTTTETVQSHLASCPDCRAASERLHQLHELLQKPTIIAPSPALDTRVMDSFDERWTAIQVRPLEKAPWWKRRIALPAPIFALSIILPLILASLAIWHGPGWLFTTRRLVETKKVEPPLDRAGNHFEPQMDLNLSRFDHGERAVIYKVRRTGAGDTRNLEQ